jgi:arginase
MSAAPTIQPNFLPSRHDVGVVAVGFSGGQVRCHDLDNASFQR